MELNNNKEYQSIKVKRYLKKDKLFFFFNGVGKNSKSWKKTKQDLKIIKFNVFKTFNRVTYKELQNSIFKNIKEIANGPVFFVKPLIKSKPMKSTLLITLNLFLFLLMAIKINNKIYPVTVLNKNINLIHYTVNNLLFYQFILTTLKYSKKLFLF